MFGLARQVLGSFFAGVDFHLDDAQKDKIKRFVTEHIYSKKTLVKAF